MPAEPAESVVREKPCPMLGRQRISSRRPHGWRRSEQLRKTALPSDRELLPVESCAKKMEVLSFNVETQVVDASRGSAWLGQCGNTSCANSQPCAPCNEAAFFVQYADCETQLYLTVIEYSNNRELIYIHGSGLQGSSSAE
jgi:hypothetical protein